MQENPYLIDFDKTIIQYNPPFHGIKSDDVVDYLAIGLTRAIIASNFSRLLANNPEAADQSSIVILGRMNAIADKKIRDDGFKLVQFERGLHHPFESMENSDYPVKTIGAIWLSNAHRIGISDFNIKSIFQRFCTIYDRVEDGTGQDTLTEYLGIVTNDDISHGAYISQRVQDCTAMWRKIIDDCYDRQSASSSAFLNGVTPYYTKNKKVVAVYHTAPGIMNMHDVSARVPNAVACADQLEVRDDEDHALVVYHLGIIFDRSRDQIIPRARIPSSFMFMKGQFNIDSLPYGILGITEDRLHVIFRTFDGMIDFIQKELY